MRASLDSKVTTRRTRPTFFSRWNSREKVPTAVAVARNLSSSSHRRVLCAVAPCIELRLTTFLRSFLFSEKTDDSFTYLSFSPRERTSHYRFISF